jgi:hypothetical protein
MLVRAVLFLAVSPSVEIPVLGTSTGAELTVRGRYSVSPGRGDEFLATLNLSLPLSHLGAPGAPTRGKQPAPLAEGPDEEPPDSEQPRPDTPGGDEDAKRVSGTPAPSDDSRPASSAVVASEPRAAPVVTPKLARETVLRALAHAGFGRARARVQAMLSRARYSALLPDLRLRGARRTDETLRLTPTLDDPYRYTLAGGSDYSFEASLTWRFDRLLFDDAELSAERLLAQRAERMQALARQVLDELFAWQRARLARRDSAALPEERQRAALEELEARTRLFVMTGGWFGTAAEFR